jgi:hypothetical protein
VLVLQCGSWTKRGGIVGVKAIVAAALRDRCEKTREGKSNLPWTGPVCARLVAGKIPGHDSNGVRFGLGLGQDGGDGEARDAVQEESVGRCRRRRAYDGYPAPRIVILAMLVVMIVNSCCITSVCAG